MRLRQIFFWLHLGAGMVAAAVIFILAASRAALAFEKEILAWAEREVRQVTVRVDAPQLNLDELLRRLRAEQPGGRPSSITLDSEANAAVRVSL